MKRVFIVSRGWWNYQPGAADFGYYNFAPIKCYTTYSAALKFVGKYGYEYYSVSERGWWTGNGLLTITEMVVEE